MNNLIFTAITVFCLFISSCSEKEILPAPHEETFYRVKVVGKGDTTTSSSMYAREQTVSLIVAEDSKFKAELISYNGSGVYVIKTTSKLNCQSIIRWGWDGLTIDSITPASDVLPALGVDTFILHGDHKVGRIKLKLESNCGNSSTLIINITNSVLPVVYIANTATYHKETGKVIVSFTIDDPMQAEWILIERLSKDKIWTQAALFAGDHTTKQYSVKI